MRIRGKTLTLTGPRESVLGRDAYVDEKFTALVTQMRREARTEDDVELYAAFEVHTWETQQRLSKYEGGSR